MSDSQKEPWNAMATVDDRQYFFGSAMNKKAILSMLSKPKPKPKGNAAKSNAKKTTAKSTKNKAAGTRKSPKTVKKIKVRSCVHS